MFLNLNERIMEWKGAFRQRDDKIEILKHDVASLHNKLLELRQYFDAMEHVVDVLNRRITSLEDELESHKKLGGDPHSF